MADEDQQTLGDFLSPAERERRFDQATEPMKERRTAYRQLAAKENDPTLAVLYQLAFNRANQLYQLRRQMWTKVNTIRQDAIQAQRRLEQQQNRSLFGVTDSGELETLRQQYSDAQQAMYAVERTLETAGGEIVEPAA